MAEPERLIDPERVGDALTVGAEYHPDENVVTIYFASPEQSTALNLEPEKEELENLVRAIRRIKKAYESR